MEVHEHPPTSPSLQHALKSALPNSINLVYRTQHTNRTEYARILATFPEGAGIPRCWAAAYLDRSMRPETELWIFAAGEMPSHSSSSEGFCPECRKAVEGLLDYMAGLPTPPMRPDSQNALEIARQHEKDHPTPGPNGVYPLSRGAFLRHLLEPKVILVGACHDAIIKIMRNHDMVRRDMPGSDVGLNKFLFKLSNLPDTRELPTGLRWGEVREQDIETVKARTDIPRSTKTLLSLKSLGVFEEETGKPVAWTFLGLDGSLTTLHTEPNYRGKGIAKAVAANIIRKHAPGLAVDDNGDAWAHADVYFGNVQSESVCKSLGGNALWVHDWVRVDLDKAGTLAKGAS
jgi:ribosomal protein S18 acetylase RimI-like enzyme